jgi:hypothetical protein
VAQRRLEEAVVVACIILLVSLAGALRARALACVAAASVGAVRRLALGPLGARAI